MPILKRRAGIEPMMKDRRLQIMAENQALMMRAMAEFLLAQRGGEGSRPLPPHVEKLALKIASRGEDLQEMIDDGFFAIEVMESQWAVACVRVQTS